MPPPWVTELTELYESGAASQFILHGNVADAMLLPAKGGSEPVLGSLEMYLKEMLLGRFDVVLSYDVGGGVRVDKGGEVFSQWPSAGGKDLPVAPREAVHLLTHYLRYAANLAKLKPEKALRVAVIVRAADLVAPPSPGGPNYELSGIAWQLCEWACDPMICGSQGTSFLLVENLNDLHPLVAQNGRAARIALPLPGTHELEQALRGLQGQFSKALAKYEGRLAEPAAALAGATLHAVETLVRTRHHRGEALDDAALVRLKKDLIERDAQGLIEFIKPERTLDDLHGQEAVKNWLRQDMALWRQGELAAMPMGYLFCGPVGTGKTFMVECLAGEAGVPVVKMKNFRDKWVGSTESNLEKIFRLLEALGRCIVFVDEADQALGRRGGESSDGGVDGRVYGMVAAQMSQSNNRGRVLWVLATSRPDLVEVDLKRPGRVDVKIPLFPTGTPEEGYALIRSLCGRRGLDLPEELPESLKDLIPDLLTPGAAEALSVKVYRMLKTSAAFSAIAALASALKDYQPPVRVEVIEEQIRLAVDEATDRSFVRERFRA